MFTKPLFIKPEGLLRELLVAHGHTHLLSGFEIDVHDGHVEASRRNHRDVQDDQHWAYAVYGEALKRYPKPKAAPVGHDPRHLLWLRIIAFLLLLLLTSRFVHAQHSSPPAQKGVIVESSNQGGTPIIIRPSGIINFNCSTNMTCAVSGNTVNLSASATGATAFSGITAATNTNAGTFAVSGNTWDFAAAGLLKLRIAAGLTTASNGEIGYDTTNLNWHVWDNAVDSMLGIFPTSLSVTDGHLVTWAKSGNTITLNDGGAVPSGGTPCTTTANSLQYNNAGAFGCVTDFTFSGHTVTSGVSGILDLTAANLVKLRIAAGLTTSVNGDLGQDTTTGFWHGWQNGHDRLFAFATNVGTAGQVFESNADGTGTFADPVISYNNPSESTAAWTSATANNTALTVTLPVGTGVLSAVVVTLNQGSTITGGQVAFNVSDTTGFTNPYPISCRNVTSGALVNSYTLTASTNIAFVCNVTSFEAFQVKLSPVITGTGTVNVGIQPTSGPVQDGVAITNFPVTQPISGSVSVSNFPGTQPISAASLPLPTSAATAANQCGTGTTPCQVSKDTSLNGVTDPLFMDPTDGAAAMGAMANFGTGPGAVKALNVNSSIYIGTGVPDTNTGNATAQTLRTAIATNNPALSNWGHGATGAAVPANVTYEGLKDTAGNGQNALSDTNGRQFIKSYPDTTTTSYHASAKFAASSTTDNAVLPGNATNTVLVTKVTLTCTETTAGQINVELLKRSTADSAGTAVNMTIVPDDANYAAGVSVPKSYTGTGPTVGTAVGDLDNAQVGCMASGTATPNDVYIFKPAKPIVLRGTAQMITVNVGNAALTGGTLTVGFEYMETTTP